MRTGNLHCARDIEIDLKEVSNYAVSWAWSPFVYKVLKILATIQN